MTKFQQTQQNAKHDISNIEDKSQSANYYYLQERGGTHFIAQPSQLIIYVYTWLFTTRLYTKLTAHRLWNSLPENLREVHNISIFQQQLKPLNICIIINFMKLTYRSLSFDWWNLLHVAFTITPIRTGDQKDLCAHGE